MLNIIGADAVIRNFYRISHPHIQKPVEAVQWQDLKTGYRRFLALYHPELPVNDESDIFINDGGHEERLCISFAEEDPRLNDLQQHESLGREYGHREKQSKIHQARRAVAELFSLDAMVSRVFDLAIHSVFIRMNNPNHNRVFYGGSTSRAIGVIWLSGHEIITKDDLLELFLHELTHNLVFIDELNHPQFNYDLLFREEYFAPSALLGIRRPLDKTVHSIIVGTELVEYRSTLLNGREMEINVHPETDELIRATAAACDSVLSMPNLREVAEERAVELVKLCRDRCLRRNSGRQLRPAARAGHEPAYSLL